MPERCPLCQGKLKNGECLFCGYKIPDEEDISALYNYDPSDYPQPEGSHIREITPEIQMEEIYPNRPEPIELKVRNSQGQTVQQNGSSNSQKYGQTGQYVGTPQNGQGSPYYNTGNYQYGKYGQQNGQYGQNTGQGSPYYNTGNYQYGKYGQQNGQYGQNTGQGSYYGGTGQQQNRTSPAGVFGIIRSYWWLALLCLFMPTFGLFAFLIAKNGIDKKYHWVFILLMLLGFGKYM